MNPVDEVARRVCEAQGDIFESSPVLPCGSAVFIRRFMNSEFASRLDEEGFLAESCSPAYVYQEIEDEYGPSNYGAEKFASEELHWIGYVYRYWCFMTGMPSKRIFRIIGAREMRDLYYPYHSLDPEQAVMRILEAKGINPGDDLVKRGVAMLRRIIQERDGCSPGLDGSKLGSI